MRARANGGENLVCLSGGKDEPNMLWGFLHQFEQRIEALGSDHVSFIDDVDLVARGNRSKHRSVA